ncbi:MAG TPA: alkaline shock response membrane anchor protein AmaP [bacterium]|nr:alkaline shock response membrane anchor protein AmaP [bacterium]HOM26204.1 alkaline shock response membrane anchor protein AmaP [bacterium]
MKIWSRIVGTIYILMGIFFVFCLLSFFSNENLCESFINFIKNNLYKVEIFATIVLIIGIIYVVNWIDYIYRTKAISFDNPSGKVRVSLKAIKDSITTTILKEIDGIKTIKVKTFVTPKGLETKINLKLFSNLNIPDICSNIQELKKIIFKTQLELKGYQI